MVNVEVYRSFTAVTKIVPPFRGNNNLLDFGTFNDFAPLLHEFQVLLVILGKNCLLESKLDTSQMVDVGCHLYVLFHMVILMVVGFCIDLKI